MDDRELMKHEIDELEGLIDKMTEEMIDLTDTIADKDAKIEEMEHRIVKLNIAVSSYQDIVKKIPRFILNLFT